MPLPVDYAERVYAGVLGKIIGVYLGRPFEGWRYQDIVARLGEITYYVHDQLGKPLIVTDDDISGTFTFLRAMPDYGNRPDLAPAQIGQTWLNYLIEERTVLWWGGMGNSTEHTAFLRLKQGIPAPRSGSIELNGRVVAEQIGAQIFIDGWAMVAPGDPGRAADLAKRAASVSHDGEAIYGAQVMAAMEAQAFVEPDISKLLDVGVAHIPGSSIIARMIGDLREWHAQEKDWRETRKRIESRYGYDTYGGGVHMVPNHALIILALLYGEGDFSRSLSIVNTCGWDTDCNSGNVGCILGIKNGLAGIDAGPVPNQRLRLGSGQALSPGEASGSGRDWRGPVADRILLSTADGGRAVTDAVTEAGHIVNIGRALAGQPPQAPKRGARFHFELPGAVQGFRLDADGIAGEVIVANVAGFSGQGTRSLAIRWRGIESGHAVRVATDTFIPPEVRTMPGYGLMASPAVYPGQTVRAAVVADAANAAPVRCRLYLGSYGPDDKLVSSAGPEVTLDPGVTRELAWRIGATGGAPIAKIGVELRPDREMKGVVYLDYLTWDGTPEAWLGKPEWGGVMWSRAWVNGVDQFSVERGYRLTQNHGRGLLIQGARDWTDYRVSAAVTPHLVEAAGLAARVQGMRRYYALLLCRDGQARLVKALDGERVLAKAGVPLNFDATYELSLAVTGQRIQGWVDGKQLFDVQDDDQPLTGGGVALVCEEGRITAGPVTVGPVVSSAAAE